MILLRLIGSAIVAFGLLLMLIPAAGIIIGVIGELLSRIGA